MENSTIQEKAQSRFIVVKTIGKRDCQHHMKRMSKKAFEETVFFDYWAAHEFSERHENCHVILEHHFQHFLTPIELAARTAVALGEEKCTS